MQQSLVISKKAILKIRAPKCIVTQETNCERVKEIKFFQAQWKNYKNIAY